MASLSGTQIKNTYIGLLKTTANDAITGSLKRITDGAGASSALQLSSSQVKADSLLIENVSETNTLTRFLTWDDTAKTVGYYNFSQSDPAVSVSSTDTTATVTTGNNANNTFTLSEGTGISIGVTGTTITITNDGVDGASVAVDAATNKFSVTDNASVTKAVKLVGSGGTTVSSTLIDANNTLETTISSLERNVTEKDFVLLTGDRNLSASDSGKTLIALTSMNSGDGLVLPEWEAGLFFDIIFNTTGGPWSLETYDENDGIFGSLTIHSGAVQNGSAVTDVMVKCGSTSFATNHNRSVLTCFQHGSTDSGRPNKINFANTYDNASSDQLVGGITGSKFTIMATSNNNWFVYGDVHSTSSFNTNIEGEQGDATGTLESYHALNVFTTWTASNTDNGGRD